MQKGNMLEKYSIRTKFALFVALLVSVTGLLIASYILWQQYRNQIDELHGDAIANSLLFQRVLTEPLRLNDEYLVFELIRAPFNGNGNSGKGLGGRSLQHILLLDDAGVVLSSSDPEHLPINVAHVKQEPEFAAVAKLLPVLKMGAPLVFVDHDETGGFYVITPLGENGVKYANLLLDYSALPLRSDFIHYGQRTVLAIALLVLLVILLGQWLARDFTLPLLTLCRRMGLLASQHDLDIKSEAKADELMRLSATFECLESALNQAEKQLLKIYEETYRRLGQELHDDVGQQITAVALLSELLTKELNDQDNPLAERAQKITQRLNMAVSRTRKLSHGLCPISTDYRDLFGLLSLLAEETAGVQGIICQLNYDSHPESPLYFDYGDAIAEEFNLQLYRIAQEAVTNAVKHSKATQIDLMLCHGKKGDILEIKDNGIGFKQTPDANSGLGMFSMSFRARLAGLQIAFLSNENGGVCVAITLPRG